MNNIEMHNELEKTQVIKTKILEQLKEYTTYNSVGMINHTIDMLQIIAKRIENGDSILIEGCSKELTLEDFKTIIKDNFSKRVYDNTFLQEN